MKNWDIHYNLGTYWIDGKHIIGNTQLYADYIDVEDIFGDEVGRKQYEIAYQLGCFVNSIRTGLSEMTPPIIQRGKTGISIDYYYDINTNNRNYFFRRNEIKLNLFYLNLVCNMNFVKRVLSPLFSTFNSWLFRIEYIVNYYSYRALQRLKNYSEINSDITINKNELTEVIHLGDGLFETKFRNCMMHYDLENQGVLSKENIGKPFYGMVESCFSRDSLEEYIV